MARMIIVTTLILVSTARFVVLETSAVDMGLYTACAPMTFVVENLRPEGTQETGLTREALENAVEARLRSARLFAPSEKLDRSQYLYVAVNITGRAFSINVTLERYLDNLGYGIGGYATVWNMRGAGTHGGDGQYILGLVSQYYLDKFVANYLRVNEAHCSR